MHKYHLADALTACEVVCAVILLGMVIWNGPPEAALITFAIGELCDAFDGIAARRWHYPDDGKYRWWRHYASEIDQLSDIILAAICGLYLVCRIDTEIGLLITASVVTVSISVETFRNLAPGHPLFYLLTMFRRYWYLGGIAAAVILLIFATSWSMYAKYTLIMLGCLAAIFLIILKLDRLTQDKTPL